MEAPSLNRCRLADMSRPLPGSPGGGCCGQPASELHLQDESEGPFVVTQW
jgi:hypothetical protein